MLLPVLYAIWFAINIGLLIRSVKSSGGRQWVILLISQVAALAASLILMHYYDSLPGSGMFPGIQYMTEVISSMGAAIANAILIVISLVVMIIKKFRH